MFFLSWIDEQQLTFIHQFPENSCLNRFQLKKEVEKQPLPIVHQKKLKSILNQEGSGLYKPWQLRDYTPSSITLKTTYDELFILGKEIAMVRPEFEVKNGEVKIPSIFAKDSRC